MLLLCLLGTLLSGCGIADKTGLTGGGNGAKRAIAVDEVNGDVKITSSEQGETAASAGMSLSSGDVVTTGAQSEMTLTLDSNKHVYASENTRFKVQATGETGATQTNIIVSAGCILVGIDNKLGEQEQFDVSTPNATFSVTGTVFYVTVSRTEEGARTELVVKEGSVSAKTVENGTERPDMVAEGQTVTYYGEAPHASSEKSSSGQSKSDQGMFGVYRGDGYTVVIAEGVPYAYNRSDGVIVDEEDPRSFCVVTDSPGLDPFFARSATMVSDTLITDYTFREDESVHVVDMEFIRDGDTLQYHRRLNEDNYDEYATLTRTGEDPTDVYLSYIQ